ncbi:formate/nitrite transporter family protein [Halomicroarcula sp. S3CR25-11]|uniref:Formate/nitrite transporter family protein n=1 Tax=Haloarcula onubensis TaxID=2950539 RepID=A0ABU2FLD7_9EURY|nr:formate/nitrite transporter family protein [Halomicroarcula sp. S3CR25-11]MDS0281209.1 formate/nitrite transporter family protein [Halomicroarcula sp. S3CR25-11]
MADGDRDESLRDAVDRSSSGAPAGGHAIRDRFSSNEIFQRIVVAADEEITSRPRRLFAGGLAGGFAITITFLLYASMTASTDGDPVGSALLYPLGFVFIILGDYELYTENTLPPVTLVLERIASLPTLGRIWVLVLLGNFAGGALGALALSATGVLSSASATAAAGVATEAIETPWWTLFTKAMVAGLIVAGVVWVDYSLRDGIARIAMVYLAFLAIPFGNLYHVVVSWTEMLYLVFEGDLALAVGVREFVVPVLLGNSIGGVLLVTVVNYFQTTERRVATARVSEIEPLSVREWLLGGVAGDDRSYVPTEDDRE